jgi:methylthioribulose-1-phosphate dehydratase
MLAEPADPAIRADQHPRRTAMTRVADRQDAVERHASERALLCELLRLFYDKGWCTGTGGGISMKVAGGYLMAPSGVAKERVLPAELFLLSEDFQLHSERQPEPLRLSECAPLFESIYRRCGAGAVIHSHSVQMVLAMSHQREQPRLRFERLEMIKGIRGASYLDCHEVPVIPNTPRECDLLDSLTAALEDLPANAHGVFVRDHGAYIWGRDVMEAKRHAEVYDWLCQYQNLDHR